MSPFNRTLVELKHMSCNSANILSLTFNRSLVELKPLGRSLKTVLFNRTLVELKLEDPINLEDV